MSTAREFPPNNLIGVINEKRYQVQEALGEKKAEVQDAVEKLITPFIQENILLRNPRYRPAGFDNELRRLTKGGRFTLVGLADHGSHPAAIMMVEELRDNIAVVNEDLPEDERITGAKIFLAYNIADKNGQNEEVSTHFGFALPIFRKFGTEPIYVVRPKDRKSMPEDEFRMRWEQQKEEISHAVAEDKALIILPEGSVNAGRQKEGGAPGERNGMIKLLHGSISGVVEEIVLQGREPIFIPMGTTGETAIYDPITGKVPEEARGTAKRGIFGRRHFIPPLMHAVVGHPISYDTLVTYLGENGKIPNGKIEQFFGELINRLIHPDERGNVYSRPALLDRVPLPKVTYEAIMASPIAGRGTLIDIFSRE